MLPSEKLRYPRDCSDRYHLNSRDAGGGGIRDRQGFLTLLTTGKLVRLRSIIGHLWRIPILWPAISSKKLPPNGPASLLTDFLGNYPLHYAAVASCHSATTLILSKHSEKPFYSNFDITPAHIAAQLGSDAILSAMSKNSVLMNAPSRYNWLPLHFALFHSRARTCEASPRCQLRLSSHICQSKQIDHPGRIASSIAFRIASCGFSHRLTWRAMSVITT
jgi:hypothetical protein